MEHIHHRIGTSVMIYPREGLLAHLVLHGIRQIQQLLMTTSQKQPKAIVTYSASFLYMSALSA